MENYLFLVPTLKHIFLSTLQRCDSSVTHPPCCCWEAGCHSKHFCFVNNLAFLCVAFKNVLSSPFFLMFYNNSIGRSDMCSPSLFLCSYQREVWFDGIHGKFGKSLVLTSFIIVWYTSYVLDTSHSLPYAF